VGTGTLARPVERRSTGSSSGREAKPPKPRPEGAAQRSPEPAQSDVEGAQALGRTKEGRTRPRRGERRVRL
jgi:hypothetical protein